MIPERYSRQMRYRHLGKEGQQKLLDAKVAIVGMGALGCVSANELVRAGVGYVRIIDRDLVELSNLQRQILFSEADAEEAKPKVFAAAEHLHKANSEVTVDPQFSDLNASNAAELLGGVDLIVDASDNIEVRYLINEFCVENRIPWIYGGALASEGMTANFLPDGPCFACFIGEPKSSGQPSGLNCSTVGVLNSLTAVVASLQVTEAVKIITGSPDVRKDLMFIDIWRGKWMSIPLEKKPECPICGAHHYEYLGKASGTQAVSICGKNAYQIIPEERTAPDLQKLQEKLSPLGEAVLKSYYLEFTSEKVSFKLFRDGRAIISNVESPGRAKAVYTEYLM